MKIKRKFNLDFLLSPWSILAGTIVGIIIGLYFPSIAPRISSINTIFVALLQMCVVPLLISSIVVSVTQIIKSGQSHNYLIRFMSTAFLIMILCSVISIGVCLLFPSISNPIIEVKEAMGELAIKNQAVEGESELLGFKSIDLNTTPQATAKSSVFVNFILNVIPSNIFNALTQGEFLKIMFFFAIFSIFVISIPKQDYSSILSVFFGVQIASQSMIRFVKYLLPFAICSSFAWQIYNIGVEGFVKMGQIITLIYVTLALLVLCSIIIIRIYSKKSIITQFAALYQMILIAVSARNVFTTIPEAINGLTGKLKLDGDKVKTVITIGITLLSYGNAIIFPAYAFFAMKLYIVPITFTTVMTLVFGGIFATLTSTASTSAIAPTLISVILDAVGVPSAVVVTSMIALNDLISPIQVLATVYANCAVATVVAVPNRFIKSRNPEMANATFNLNETKEIIEGNQKLNRLTH